MQEHSVQIKIISWEREDEMAEVDRILLAEARAALNKAYAPYSRFRVGAAARLADGQMVSSANQENASYPLCLCAEQTLTGAIRSLDAAAVIAAIAITARRDDGAPIPPAAPCGACRQILLEWERRQGSPIRILLQGSKNQVVEFAQCQDLLPMAFNESFLPDATEFTSGP